MAESPVEEDAAERTSRRTSGRRVLLSGLLVVAMVVAFGWALAGQWSEIVDQLGEQRPAVLAGSLALALAGVYL
ncbi:MAG: hypothetical protein ACRDV2_04065, partial [Actinomycetes bacterium]